MSPAPPAAGPRNGTRSGAPSSGPTARSRRGRRSTPRGARCRGSASPRSTATSGTSWKRVGSPRFRCPEPPIATRSPASTTTTTSAAVAATASTRSTPAPRPARLAPHRLPPRESRHYSDRPLRELRAGLTKRSKSATPRGAVPRPLRIRSEGERSSQKLRFRPADGIRRRLQIRSSSRALSTARVRSRTPSFERIVEMWFFTVPSARVRASAISRLL